MLWPGTRAARLWAVTGLVALCGGSAATATLDFVRTYVDLAYGGNGRPGWVRSGDMDGDGDLDIVAGGGTALFVYENDGSAGGWERHGNLDGTNGIGGNGGALFDVDADGDLDVICAQYTDDLGWWENPGPPLATASWTFRVLSNESRYLHDMILVDLDQDGVAEEFVANLNQGYWNANITIKWLRPGSDPTQPWESHTIESNRNEGPAHGHAGLDVGDVDEDGNLDLAYSNGWYEAPDDPVDSWTWHEVTDQIYGISNALLRDMDDDGDLDLVVSGGHHGAGVFWLEAPTDPVSGAWTEHTVDSAVHHPECLAVLDIDEDDDPDIVSCDLFFGEDPGEPGWDEEVHNIYIYENLGEATSWSSQNIVPDSFPSHLLQMVDMNVDGRMDIISEATGTSVVSYYENTTAGLGCIDDAHEPDDSCAEANPLPLEATGTHRHCDEDWVRVATIAGATYEVVTRNLTGGADTFVEVHQPACGALVAEDDDSGPGTGSLATWAAPAGGEYEIRTLALDGYANGEGYEIEIECIFDCGLCVEPETLDLADETIDDGVVYEACDRITTGTGMLVTGTGHLTLRAGNRITLGNGFASLGGAAVTLEIDRSLR